MKISLFLEHRWKYSLDENWEIIQCTVLWYGKNPNPILYFVLPFQLVYHNERCWYWSTEINSKYRDSPVSAVFWSPANRTIGKTALIEHWFSTKIAIWDFWVFKVHFFHLLSKSCTRKTLIFNAFTVGQFPLVQISNLKGFFNQKHFFFHNQCGVFNIFGRNQEKFLKKKIFNFFFSKFSWKFLEKLLVFLWKTALNRGMALFSAVCKPH